MRFATEEKEGQDLIDGGGGLDTAIHSGLARDDNTVLAPGVTGVIPTQAAARRQDGIDKPVSIARIGSPGGWESREIGAVNFKPLDCIASHNGLVQVLGANAAAGTRHYLDWGYQEGRPDELFGGKAERRAA